jgi:hypothetical protein
MRIFHYFPRYESQHSGLIMDTVVTEINTSLCVLVSGSVKNANDRLYSAVLFSLWINIHNLSINISVSHHTSRADRKVKLLVYICEWFS